MKKWSLILFLLMIIPFSVFAQIDVKSMSDEELRSAKNMIEKELTAREHQKMENSTDRVMIPLDNLDFEANDDFTEVTITGFHNDYNLFRDKIIEIPSEIQELPVTKILNRLSNQSIFKYTNAKGVYIPDSVKVIGAYAFSGSRIKKIRLPNGLEKIGDYAFYDSDLESIELPDSLTWIGEYAFASTNIRTLLLQTNLQYIGSKAFVLCNELETVEIPNNFICESNMKCFLTDIIDGTKLRKDFAFMKRLKGIELKPRYAESDGNDDWLKWIQDVPLQTKDFRDSTSF